MDILNAVFTANTAFWGEHCLSVYIDIDTHCVDDDYCGKHNENVQLDYPADTHIDLLV